MAKGKKGTTTSTLATRELEIVELRAQGKSFYVIGELLGISISTVNSHKRRATRKLGFGSYPPSIEALRTALARYHSLTGSPAIPPRAGDCSPASSSEAPGVSSSEPP